MFENDAIKLSSFVEGQTRSLKGNSFLIRVLAPRRHATSGWIIRTGNQGAPRGCDQHMSPLLCTAYTSASSQYTPLAPCFFGERGCHHSPEVHPTGGSLRVFKQFVWLEVDSVKVALSRPTHQRVTQAVGRSSYRNAYLTPENQSSNILDFAGKQTTLVVLSRLMEKETQIT